MGKLFSTEVMAQQLSELKELQPRSGFRDFFKFVTFNDLHRGAC